MGSRRAVRRDLYGCFPGTNRASRVWLFRSVAQRGIRRRGEMLLTSEAEVIESTIPQEPAMDTKNGRDNSPPEGEKPIIDQMTDLAAQAAGTLAETAVKTGAKKAKRAVARRLPGPVKKAAKTIARAAKTGATKSRATRAIATKSRSAKARATSKKTVKKAAKKSPTRSAKTSQSRARRRTVGKKTATRATKKARRRRGA
jgi:hypothetical protein